MWDFGVLQVVTGVSSEGWVSGCSPTYWYNKSGGQKEGKAWRTRFEKSNSKWLYFILSHAPMLVQWTAVSPLTFFLWELRHLLTSHFPALDVKTAWHV